MSERPILELDEVTKTFTGRAGLGRGKTTTLAVDAVSLGVRAGESFGLVGESGSGKTTLGRMIVGLTEPTSGSIRYDDRELAGSARRALEEHQRSVQMIFQNSVGSLNPRRRVGRILRDPLEIHEVVPRAGVADEVRRLLELVGLPESILARYPHQVSSGQRQRVGIARALSVRPRFVVADEPVSALDASVAAQILNLLRDLVAQLGVSFVFISHDLRAVSFISDRIGVLYAGQLVEIGTREQIIGNPSHPYTRGLLDSAPGRARATGRIAAIHGELATDAADTGCRFAARCPLRRRLGSPAVCVESRPSLAVVDAGHEAACHFAADAATTSLPIQRRRPN